MLQNEQRLEELSSGVKVIISKSFSFGLDAVALSYFSFPKSGMQTADLGTGCGIIPLLWCTSRQDLHVDAIEIQRQAALAAQEAVSLSGLDNIINVINGDYMTCPELLSGSYDMIVCNPPYMKAGSGKASKTDSARIARHETGTSIREITARASSLLKNGGRFCLCYRPERMPELFSALSLYSLEPKRLRFIQHTAGACPSIILLESRKNARPGLKVEPVLLADSDEMSNIYDNFRKKDTIR